MLHRCSSWNSALRRHSRARSQGRILLNAHDTILSSSYLPAQTVSAQEPGSKKLSPDSEGLAPVFSPLHTKSRHCDQQIRSAKLNPNAPPRQGTLMHPTESCTEDFDCATLTWPPLSPGDRQRDPHPRSKISATASFAAGCWLRSLHEFDLQQRLSFEENTCGKLEEVQRDCRDVCGCLQRLASPNDAVETLTSGSQHDFACSASRMPGPERCRS